MFLRILAKSFGRRKTRFAIAVVAVIMGAAVASALITVSLDIRDKVTREFAAFGANIIVVPKSESVSVSIGDIDFGSVQTQNYIQEDELYKIKLIKNWSSRILGFAPYLYAIVKVQHDDKEDSVVLTGTWFDHQVPEVETRTGDTWNTGVKAICPWWELRGSWPSENDTASAIVGKSVYEKIGLAIGDKFTVIYNDTINETVYELEVIGILEAGGSEDNQIFVNLDVVQYLTHRGNIVQTVQVSALCNQCPVESIVYEIEQAMPNVEAKSVKSVVQAQMQLLGKVEHMMILITLVALFASALGVMTTMTTSVVERTREIGMMKAIGAEDKKIAGLFFVEALLIGAIGGVLGYIIGYVLAQYIGHSTFQSSINLQLVVVPIAIGISTAITLLASALPIRRALKIEPVRALRGE